MSCIGSSMDIVNEDRINEEKVYREAFDDFDWNKSGTIPNSVSFIPEEVLSYRIFVKCLL